MDENNGNALPLAQAQPDHACRTSSKRFCNKGMIVALFEILTGWFIKLNVKTFQLLIVINRRG